MKSDPHHMFICHHAIHHFLLVPFPSVSSTSVLYVKVMIMNDKRQVVAIQFGAGTAIKDGHKNKTNDRLPWLRTMNACPVLSCRSWKLRLILVGVSPMVMASLFRS